MKEKANSLMKPFKRWNGELLVGENSEAEKEEEEKERRKARF